MKIWQGIIIMAIALLSGVWGFGCASCEDEAHRVESGQYVVIEEGLGIFNWLAHAQMNIDRAAKTTTIRYTRNGTTYDVRFTLAQ